MAKVITSAGLNEFIESGKHETIKADAKPKPAEAPALDVKIEQPAADLKPAEPKKDEPQDDIYAEEDQETKEEITKAKRFDALMRKKHRAMKEAQEAAAENDRLAESQFNRARLAEQKLAEVEAQLKEFQAKAIPQQEQPKPKPDPQKYYDDKGQFKAFEYAEDLAAWSADQKVAEYVSSQEQARINAIEQELSTKLRERTTFFMKDHPDFDEVVGSINDVKWRPEVLGYLRKRQYSPHVQYYLGQHRSEAERISKLPPDEAVADLRVIELTFEKPPEAPKAPPAPPQAVSGAPAPIVPLEVSRSVDVQTDPSKMPYKQLRAYERQRERDKRTR